MIFNKLPEKIFAPIDTNKFLNRTMEIISSFNINHRLMIKAFAINNKNSFEENLDNIKVYFENDTEFIFEFDNKNRIINDKGKM